MSPLGQYYAVPSFIHRLPAGTKFLLMFAIGFVPFFAASIWVSGTALAIAVLFLLWAARIPARIALPLPWPFLLMMAGLLTYHCFATSSQRGILYVFNVLTVVYLARLITCTTPVNELMDAIAAACRPLRIVGANPEKIALAFAVMWRSIPHLLGIFAAVRDSAHARGLRGFSPRYFIPAIVQAVGFGLSTSDALRARGLD